MIFNPIQSILGVEMKIQERLFTELKSHLKWGAKLKGSEANQYS